MFKRVKPTCFEENSMVEHPEHQIRNTRVSEYLRKYGQGKLDELPTDKRLEITDSRTVDQMLDEPCESLGTDELDVLMQLEKYQERFRDARADIEATEKQKEQFEAAVKVLNDGNASYNDRQKAVAVLDELERQGKIKRAYA